VALVRTDESEEYIASICKVTFMMEAKQSSETSVLTTAKRRQIAEVGIYTVAAVITSNLT
jgi:hypothetical protein